MLRSKARRDFIFGIAAGSGVLLFTTWVAFHLHFNLSAATSLQLLLVVLVAFRRGFVEASIVSILAVVCLDYFFTQPVFALTITDPQDWLALSIFGTVALLVSRLSSGMKRHSAEAEAQRSQLQKLYELSQGILLLNWHESAQTQLANLIRTILKIEGVALWNAYEMHLYISGNCGFTEEEVRSVYFTEQAEDDFEKAVCKRVLRIGARPIGSLVLCGQGLDAMPIDATASIIAIAIERARSFSTESNAEAARQSEQLRSTVLDALAHAYKTPLTTIKSSSSGLLEIGALSEVQQDLVSLIDDEVEHLIELTDRLLRTAELDRKALKLRRREVDIFELVNDIVHQHKDDMAQHPIHIELPGPQTIVLADTHLFRMAFEQLLDNALKYASPQTPVSVSIKSDEAEAIIAVHNKGSYIAVEEQQQIFNRFFRGTGTEHRAAGTGIGLSVAKRITTAHHGRIWVTSDPQAGTSFFIALPKILREK